MAITNGYVLLEDMRSAMRITDSDDNLLMELHIEAASRMIDGWCGRRFHVDGGATARTFRASNPGVVFVDDISTTTGLVIKTDTTGDGTFDTTWTAADYQLEPLNGQRSGQTWPYHTIRASGSFDFPIWGTSSNGCEALVEVTAVWGWPAVPEPVRNACLIQAISLTKAKDAPLGFAGFGDMGAMRMTAALHPTAKALLQPFRRNAVKVA